MRAGLHYWNFTTPGHSASIASDLSEVARAAESSGFAQLTVMDHYFQMELAGDPAEPMLEAYTTLGYLAAQTEKIRLAPLVTGVTYRHPGLLAKIATTLDVLSRGRSALGIGAAWYEREHDALGVPYPPIRERFERLEETLRIVLQMWSDENGAFDGEHYHLAETLNSPGAVSLPHPPILIGGRGERKTLRLAARYAQIVNLMGSDPDDVAHLLDVLRRHCDDVGTDYDAIEKQAMSPRVPPDSPEYLDTLQRLAALGIDLVVLRVQPNAQRKSVDQLAHEVVPRLAEM